MKRYAQACGLLLTNAAATGYGDIVAALVDFLLDDPDASARVTRMLPSRR